MMSQNPKSLGYTGSAECHLVPATLPRPVLGAHLLHPLKLRPHVRHEVLRLVEVLGAEGVVLDELDVVVLGDVPLAVVPRHNLS